LYNKKWNENGESKKKVDYLFFFFGKEILEQKKKGKNWSFFLWAGK
jgi:hypothetical protein